MTAPNTSSSDHALPDVEPAATPGERARAYAVHVFTACGVVCVFLAAAELCRPVPDARVVFAYLAAQVLIDAVDGPMARRWQVKRFAPHIDGRTIDDIVDYLSYTFVPLLLVWRLGWVPAPAALWVAPAMVASLFGFANTGAKDERAGFFLGFPSYWNIVALYAGLFHAAFGPWPGGLLIAALTILTVCPVRFLYPNLAPHPWRWPVLLGSAIWLVQVVFLLPTFPHVSMPALWASLIYPVAYVLLSLYLDRRRVT